MKTIVHISEVNITPDSGMGRVEWHWKNAFEKLGFTFVHIGPAEVGPYSHPSLFPFKAKKYLAALKINPDVIIVHEPASGLFTGAKVPCFVESHGIEQRFWEIWKSGVIDGLPAPGIKSKILFPLWRLLLANRGLKSANKILLLNQQDKSFVKSRFNRKAEDIFVFENGVDLPEHNYKKVYNQDVPVILFNGSWIPRKGINTLKKAVSLLAKEKTKFKLTIIGTGDHVSEEEIKDAFPGTDLTIVRKFNKQDEAAFLLQSDILVLPSFYEGMPLSLLQAMAYGLCCVTTDTCGQKDLIENNKDGFLFEPGDFNHFTSILTSLLNDKSLIAKTGNAAFIKLKDYSWDNVSDSVVNFVVKNL